MFPSVRDRIIVLCLAALAGIVTGCNFYTDFTEISLVDEADAGPDDAETPEDGGRDIGLDTGEVADGSTDASDASDISDMADMADMPDSADMSDASGDSGFDAADADLPAVSLPGALIAYDFEMLNGALVPDVSSAGAYPLQANGVRVVVADGSMTVDAASSMQTVDPPATLATAVNTSGEFTLALWVETAAVDQADPTSANDNRRVVTISTGAIDRNFTIGQWQSEAVVRVRASEQTNQAEGKPQIIVPNAFADDLPHFHVVQVRGGQLEYYVDGSLILDTRVGTIAGWNTTYGLMIGDEFLVDRGWAGTVHDLRLYDRSFSPAEIQAAFDLGLP